MKKLGLMEVLEGIEDTRRKLSVWYPLHTEIAKKITEKGADYILSLMLRQQLIQLLKSF